MVKNVFRFDKTLAVDSGDSGEGIATWSKPFVYNCDSNAGFEQFDTQLTLLVYYLF